MLDWDYLLLNQYEIVLPLLVQQNNLGLDVR